MKDLWTKFGCFITGYSYSILRHCSEGSLTAVKRYLSAILIVGTLWVFVGYAFTDRYLHGGNNASLLGAFIMLMLVIQIERQIILTIGRNSWAFVFRFLIGILMAIIGSVMLDQIIFKDDVEKAKIGGIQKELNTLLPIKTQQLTSQIDQIDSSIQAKEEERAAIIDELGRKPTITTFSTVTQYQKDPTSGTMIPSIRTVTNNPIPNPKADLIPQIDAQIKSLREQKTAKENEKLNIQQVLDHELKSKVGFLDELKIMFLILFSSSVARVIWFLFFFFFLAIELFVLVNKVGSLTDYDETILQQMQIRIKMVKQLVEGQLP